MGDQKCNQSECSEGTIVEMYCIQCGLPVQPSDFRDSECLRTFMGTGMCQSCQDANIVMQADDIPHVAIHTHDRICFKRCRRQWNYRSELRRHLVPMNAVSSEQNLWFGSGFHFALEDYHGYNHFKRPTAAFMAYVEAHKDNEIPIGGIEMVELAERMLSYYTDYWLPRRNVYKTVWIDGKPQVEVQFKIQLPMTNAEGLPVFYEGTFDRLVQDENGWYWLMDYKTVARFNTSKLANDAQVSAYCWAAEIWFGVPVAGMIYAQFSKKPPSLPKILKNGELSLDQRQNTCYGFYRDALMHKYPDGKFPPHYIEFLDMLAAKETPEGDDFIRFDKVERNSYQKASEYRYILMEVQDMINPDIPIYPNPTRDCAWDCAFFPVCLAEDDGGDAEYLLTYDYKKKGGEPEWRKRIQWPTEETV